MLNEIRIENFRCFKDHVVVFNSTTILVGANNAGKSTLVEALRILSLVVTRYRGLIYRDPPGWTELPRQAKGVSPSTRDVELRGGSVFHRYGEPPAKITATFSCGIIITICIGADEELFGTITDPDGNTIKSKGTAKNIDIPSLSILPQIGPLLQVENVLNPETVRRAIDSSLASRHFRNQLLIYKDQHFDRFCQEAEDTWPGLHIESLEKAGDVGNEQAVLLLRDGNFVAEAGWMGHGLQMWLQTMWFLSRVDRKGTVILDEPDVYMHADLQRKLVRLLRGRCQQTIVATHSIEIMSEVEADEILVVDKSRRTSRFATSMPAVQQVIERLGGVQNIHLARLWGSRKCLHVEGKDIGFLRHVQNALFPTSDVSFAAVPRISLGGWGGWEYAIGSTMNLRNSAGDSIASYCIFDRDYHTTTEIELRYKQAAERGVYLHIWQRKEIENYFLVGSTIARLISSRCKSCAATADDIEAELIRITDKLKDSVFDAIADEFHQRNRRGGTTKANRHARDVVEASWESLQDRLRIVSGKTAISELSKWSQQEFGVSFVPLAVAREMKRSEIPAELKTVVRSIENGRAFPASLKEGHGILA